MISKKLLSDVVGVPVTSIEFKDEVVIYNGCFVVNIYKLIHLMKVWATTKRITVSSATNCLNNKGKVQIITYQSHETYLSFIPTDKWFFADTEQEAIFKACDWILKRP